MKKFFLTIFFLILVILTTYIKNSTKKLDEEIYLTKEKIGFLNNKYDLIKLEYDYISSPEKLIEYYNLYFDDSFNFLELKSIGKIDFNNKNLIYYNLLTEINE
ncbi:MAG: hypothetical protein CBE49_004115 [Rickettsiales bacterium TMED289]|nr:MAG: hypothetical protein CBE49_004115 [Rickettsiales bacterium TMED289]|tara:strand:+ start:3116 stop:3424 length:309 start_codon:yes stop_codon:yes gene_type:complete